MARRSAQSEDGEPDPRDRGGFTPEYTPQFADALDKLDQVTAGEVIADVTGFFDRWQASTTDDELTRSHWSYKTVHTSYRAAKLKQIRVADIYRVALTTVVDESRFMWFVLLYHKRNQVREIERAGQLVRLIREERAWARRR